jgi:outer membrane murein-binding lipoprotein Lpp
MAYFDMTPEQILALEQLDVDEAVEKSKRDKEATEKAAAIEEAEKAEAIEAARLQCEADEKRQREAKAAAEKRQREASEAAERQREASEAAERQREDAEMEEAISMSMQTNEQGQDSTVSDLEKRLEAALEEAASERAKVKELKTKVQGLEGKVQGLKEDVQRLEHTPSSSTAEDDKAKAKRLQDKVNKLEEELRAQKGSTTASDEVTQLKAKVNKLEEELRAQKGSTTASDEVTQLKAKVNELEGERKRLEGEVQRADPWITSNEANLRMLAENILGGLKGLHNELEEDKVYFLPVFMFAPILGILKDLGFCTKVVDNNGVETDVYEKVLRNGSAQLHGTELSMEDAVSKVLQENRAMITTPPGEKSPAALGLVIPEEPKTTSEAEEEEPDTAEASAKIGPVAVMHIAVMGWGKGNNLCFKSMEYNGKPMMKAGQTQEGAKTEREGMEKAICQALEACVEGSTRAEITIREALDKIQKFFKTSVDMKAAKATDLVKGICAMTEEEMGSLNAMVGTKTVKALQRKLDPKTSTAKIVARYNEFMGNPNPKRSLDSGLKETKAKRRKKS